MTDNEFKILGLYFDNKSISWFDLRTKLIKQPDFMDIDEDTLSSINQRLIEYRFLTDLKKIGNQTYIINENGKKYTKKKRLIDESK